jgi:eukaryotic translation initiation factor 2C
MKVNAKLGGTTCRVPPPNKSPTQPPFWNIPTMIVGCDVSHPMGGINAPSMAALTMSMDKDASKYAATCETNGYRVEMLNPINIRTFFNRLMPMWCKNLGSGDPPRHLYYFRDGVSEGQFAQVLEHEILEIKHWFREKFNGKVPKFTVIVATKRHHVRMFPAANHGDKNGNCLPGTLLEKEVTHPFQWDFYLCSHSAIQGTARPVHYHVILDEAGVTPQALQKMIYQQCYQYARSTTPVSLHPAIYYADLACGRARTHESVATSEGFRTGPKAAELKADFGAKGISMGGPPRGTESKPLLPLGGQEDSTEAHRNFIRSTMWFI